MNRDCAWFVAATSTGGSGLPMPSSRTFAAAIQAFAHSKETVLRHPGCARFPTPLDWHGQPRPDNPDPTTPTRQPRPDNPDPTTPT